MVGRRAEFFQQCDQGRAFGLRQALGGTIRVKNEVKIEFEVQLVR